MGNLFTKATSWFIFLGASAQLSVCVAQSTVKLRVVGQFGKQTLQLNQPYATLNGDTVELTRFVYYLSNIELVGRNQTVWRQPESYHLLEISEEGQSTFEIELAGVPPGEYTGITFALGVDSLRNHSGEQVGALDPDNGMFWMWETGYVFLKAEGFYRRPAGQKRAMVYHIGRDDCYQPVQLNFPSARRIKVGAGAMPTVQLVADARLLFGGPGAAIQLKAPVGEESISVMGGPKAPKVARNYARMFFLAP
ncbi:MAG: hypothetical protein H7Z75_19175 [Ferruginibacter sp.]|nr:hypothetical protein [Cytophagales bacterium]